MGILDLSCRQTVQRWKTSGRPRSWHRTHRSAGEVPKSWYRRPSGASWKPCSTKDFDWPCVALVSGAAVNARRMPSRTTTTRKVASRSPLAQRSPATSSGNSRKV